MTVSSTPASAYVNAVRADGASHLWRLGDKGPIFLDTVAADGTSSGATFGVAGAVAGDMAVTSGGGATPKLASSSIEAHPSAVSVEAWVNTTTTSRRSGSSASGQPERHEHHDDQ